MAAADKARTILLIDDDDEVRRLLGRGLEREGFRVVAAADEREAAELAAHAAPDLILVELGRVPPEAVLSAGKRVRERAGVPDEVPVVAYANAAGGSAREGEAVEVGPREYVVLPEDGEQLRDWLWRLAACLVTAVTAALLQETILAYNPPFTFC